MCILYTYRCVDDFELNTCIRVYVYASVYGHVVHVSQCVRNVCTRVHTCVCNGCATGAHLCAHIAEYPSYVAFTCRCICMHTYMCLYTRMCLVCAHCHVPVLCRVYLSLHMFTRFIYVYTLHMVTRFICLHMCAGWNARRWSC